MRSARRRNRPRWLAVLFFCLPTALGAHGGVVAEDDLCVIRIGYLEAHFKIYVPAATGHREYCEDIPVRGESVFIMEYLHDGLGERPIAFRIIRNTTGKGIHARQPDVDALPDLDAVTVRYQPPSVVPDVYMLLQDFPTTANSSASSRQAVQTKRAATRRSFPSPWAAPVPGCGRGYSWLSSPCN